MNIDFTYYEVDLTQPNIHQILNQVQDDGAEEER